MKKDIRNQGMEAARVGRSLYDCPYFHAKRMPAHTGEPIATWLHRVEAWELGWQEFTDTRLGRQDRPAVVADAEQRVLIASVNVLRQQTIINDLAERGCALTQAIELLHVMQDILLQYENRLAWLAAREERQPRIIFRRNIVG